MCSNKKPIGGFFELEIPFKNNVYHNKAIALSNGRACLNLILKTVKPKKVYIPYYTCNALFEPFNSNNIQYELYDINEQLNPVSTPTLKEGEYFLYINYFGIKNDMVGRIIDKYKDKTIIDNVHDFFNKGYDGIWSFTTARKYFGVPDGAYLYSPFTLSEEFERNSDISISHLVNRLMGSQELAYRDFLKYEKSLNSDVKKISKFSEILLSNVDYYNVARIRKRNFQFFMDSLKKYNSLDITYYDDMNPFCYPLLPSNTIDKTKFHREKYYIPSYWIDTINRNIDGYNIEKQLSVNLIPLPIDHRYEINDLEKLLDYLIDILRS
jgi:hypothetical protein